MSDTEQVNPISLNKSGGDVKQELREKIGDHLANLMVKASLKKLEGGGNVLENGREYIRMHSEELDAIEQLLTDTVKAKVNKALDDVDKIICDAHVSSAIEQVRKEINDE